LTFACLVASPAVPLWAQATNAQPGAANGGAAAPAAGQAGLSPAAASANPSRELVQAAEDFWHYASIAKYDLAAASGQKVLSMNAPAPDVLAAFEQVVNGRNRRVPQELRVTLDERVLHWQLNPQLKDVATQLIQVFRDARGQVASNPDFIVAQVRRLSVNRRAYEFAMEELRRSGEMAVPIMIAFLRDPQQREHHIAIRNALRDLGRQALSPLHAATEMDDWTTLQWVISALGDIGYRESIPYLVRLLQTREVPQAVKQAATQALVKLEVPNPNELQAARLFVELAEGFYNERVQIVPNQGAQEWFVWTWANNALTKVNVPASIFNEHMALRAAETALSLDESRTEAVSLWLAAAYRREVQIPEGGADPLWPEGHPDTHYYAVSSGTQHLSAALARALQDGDSAVAHKAVKSLQEIAGNSNIFAQNAGGAADTAVFDAMRYPDRQVRFEAAFTIANAVPQQQFNGQDRVVPILAEALGQTGKPGVLVIASSQDRLNALREQLGDAYNVQGGTSVDAAVGSSNTLPSVDVVIINEDHQQVDRLLQLSRESARLEGAAILIRATASEVASPFAQPAQQNKRLNVTAAPDDAIPAAIEAARTRAAGLAVDEKLATDYALRAASVLEKLAVSKGHVLDLAVAQNALLGGLNDARPELVLAVGEALAMYNAPQAQAGLITKALDGNTLDDMKIALLNDLATNAKFYGNHLDATQVDALTNVVATAPNLDVRSAAAEAHGALNLRTDQVKTLILNHGKNGQQK
jgi:hypothetical protein